MLQVTFRIVGGSGHFAVKGSDAEVGRTVYHGKADIMVKYICLFQVK